jgi:hypothetical protein
MNKTEINKKEILQILKQFGGGVYEKCGKSLTLKGGRGAINHLQKLFTEGINKNDKNNIILNNNQLGIIVNSSYFKKFYIPGIGSCKFEYVSETDIIKSEQQIYKGLPINSYIFNIEDWKNKTVYTSSVLREMTIVEKIKRFITKLK